MKVLIVDDSKLLQRGLINALRKVDENSMSIQQADSHEETVDLFSHYGTTSGIQDIDVPVLNKIETTHKAGALAPNLLLLTSMCIEKEWFSRLTEHWETRSPLAITPCISCG